jgi:methylmalonyl-CoA mutase cobalamin-binding subunit
VGEPSLVVGAALGECVHTAGVLNFLAAARRAGYRTEFLGPAVSVPLVVEAAAARHPELLALSYRLTPEAAERLFARLGEALAEAGLAGQRLVFGGTPVVAEVAARCGLFEAVFGGAGGPSAEEFLSGQRAGSGPAPGAQSLVERCREAAPRPLIRHHFGLPDLESTVEGIGRIAAAGVVDVVSLGPDQNFQEHFFHPERMDPAQDGAGGVPVRHPDDLRRLYQATRQGHHPLMRCYTTPSTTPGARCRSSGTRNWTGVPSAPWRRPSPSTPPWWAGALDAGSRWNATTRTSGDCARPPMLCRWPPPPWPPASLPPPGSPPACCR